MFVKTSRTFCVFRVCIDIVYRRIKWHKELSQDIKQKILDGYLDEGHILEISSINLDVEKFLGLNSWLTTSQAQIEFTEQLLDKHRGSVASSLPILECPDEC